MKATFGDMTDEIFKAYGIETDEDVLSQKGLDLASDLFTGFPTWKVCDYHAKSGLPVYRYHYMHPRPQVSAKMGDKVGALAGGVREKTAEEKKAEAQQPAIAPGTTTGRKRITPSRNCSSPIMPTSARQVIPMVKDCPSGLLSLRRTSMPLLS